MPARHAKARAIDQTKPSYRRHPISVQGFPRPATGLPMADRKVPHPDSACKCLEKGVGCWKSLLRPAI